MGKAAQEKARFRWYDTTRYEVSNKVSEAERSSKARTLIHCNMTAGPTALQRPCLCTSAASTRELLDMTEVMQATTVCVVRSASAC